MDFLQLDTESGFYIDLLISLKSFNRKSLMQSLTLRYKNNPCIIPGFGYVQRKVSGVCHFLDSESSKKFTG